jgi:heme/copper-type cytochrome/quinol oxidase subunit 2
VSPSPENDHRDEVVVPDEVSDPGDGPVRPARRDRKPLIACVAGITACWFAVFGPILVVVLAPTAFVIGRRVLRRIELSGGTTAERKQAKIGVWAGIVAVILLVVQLIIFQLFFEWEKDGPAIGDKAASTEPAG